MQNRLATLLEKPPRALQLVMLLAAALSIGALASGLPRLELRSGRIYTLPEAAGQEARRILDILPDSAVTTGGDLLAALLLAALLVSTVFMLVSREARKGLLRRVVRMLVWAAALYVLVSRGLHGLNQLQLDPASNLAGSTGAYPAPPFNPDPPGWLVYAASLALVLLASGLAWWVWLRPREQRSPLEALGEQARLALQELESGVELRSAVLRCYAEMCATLDQQRGLHRPQSMTAREFEQRLTAAGLPALPVQRLTRLFEQVRYSLKDAGPDEEREARACLAAIASAVGVSRGRAG